MIYIMVGVFMLSISLYLLVSTMEMRRHTKVTTERLRRFGNEMDSTSVILVSWALAMNRIYVSRDSGCDTFVWRHFYQAEVRGRTIYDVEVW